MTVSRQPSIEVTYRIVTPMFCSGADQNTAELRLPSIKGAMRFWWRSLMWGHVKNCQELREQETALFGASDQRCGQSRVQLRVTTRSLESQVAKGEIFEGGQLLGAHYLGYGVMESFDGKKTRAGRLTRPMIPGGQFTVACRFSPFATDKQIDQIRRTLILIGTIGGLGSKARKGFGSLSLTSLRSNGADLKLPRLASEHLRESLSDLNKGVPDWTAWSTTSRVVQAVIGTSMRPVDVLDALGREEVHFRSWGRDGRVLRQPSEKNFPADHDLSKGFKVGIDYPFRVAFGLPHNYGKGSQNEVAPENYDRRASPLFLHIHQPAIREMPQGVAAFLPSRFLPEGEQLQAFGRRARIVCDESFWFPIHAFLDRLQTTTPFRESRAGYEAFPTADWCQKKTSLTGEEVSLG